MSVSVYVCTSMCVSLCLVCVCVDKTKHLIVNIALLDTERKVLQSEKSLYRLQNKDLMEWAASLGISDSD